ncbi:hypothetical protein K0038_04856 [Pseudomonas syringae]|uniref:hypothetical protein n=1 Tax=Pseudomonas syringae TaxID=317 RepID=UPI001CA955A5|nr:hypothetical protein [Pseudomonas syringae]MCI3947750.1 hypothetical protein [Pseudomonas syringae]
MPINTVLSQDITVIRAALARLFTVAALFASAVTPLHAEPLHLDLEFADSSMAYLDEATQNALWPEVWSKAELTAYYLPAEKIEGETQETRSHLKLFSCMVGVACIPNPHFETKTSVLEREVTVRGQVVQSAAGQPLKLRFELPEEPAPHYRFDRAEVQAPAQVLWRDPLFKQWKKDMTSSSQRLFAKYREQPLSFWLAPSKRDTPAYQLVDLGVPTPGSLMDRGDPVAVTTVRASLSGTQGNRVLEWPGQLAKNMTKRLQASTEFAEYGRLPSSVSDNQVPWGLSIMYGEHRTGPIAVPASLPRWYGLKHYNFPEGTLFMLSRNGPLVQIELSAETDVARAIEDEVPVKSDTWTFFNGQLMHYHGEIRYFHGPSDVPATQWRVDWKRNGERLYTHAINVNPSDEKELECHHQGCQDNMAEALAQLAATDAQLVAEGKRYLVLANQIDEKRR